MTSARVRAATALLAAALCGACRLEKRPDAPGNELALDVPAPVGSAADSAEAVLGTMAQAIEAGDRLRVSELSTQDAVLIDQNEQVRWTRPDSAGPLPAPLPIGDVAPGWHLLDSSYMRLSPDAALFSLRYAASMPVDSIPRIAVESWVMVRTDGRWRVQYLHRSRGITGNAPRP